MFSNTDTFLFVLHLQYTRRWTLLLLLCPVCLMVLLNWIGGCQLVQILPSFRCPQFRWCALLGVWWSSIGEGQQYMFGQQLFNNTATSFPFEFAVGFATMLYLLLGKILPSSCSLWCLLDVEDGTLLLMLQPVHTASAIITPSCLTVFFNWKHQCQLVQVLPSFYCQAAQLVCIIWSVVAINWNRRRSMIQVWSATV